MLQVFEDAKQIVDNWTDQGGMLQIHHRKLSLQEAHKYYFQNLAQYQSRQILVLVENFCLSYLVPFVAELTVSN